NLGGLANTDDVDVGYVKLTSPTISLDDNQIYSVNLSLWWKNLDGTGMPDDTLFVRFTDSLNTYNAAFYTYEDSLEWFDINLPLNDDLDKSSFQIEILTVESQTGNDHVVEAGVDYFSIQSLTGNFSISDIDEDVIIFPNPTFDGKIFIKNNNSPVTYEVYHITGELVQKGSDLIIQLNQKGIYFIRIIKDNIISTKKVIY
ncbi:MAG: T9SS type A sorting domain-containing protein, partial [Bacteroidota bacterium]|nr:T9SS type A sorting domain-containing protein [Bacteroidota bacterium]